MKRQARVMHKHRAHWGQAMAEYLVVISALIGGLLVANQGACPSQYRNCIQYLQTVMRDNYAGYSASISAVHQFAQDYPVTDTSGGWTPSPPTEEPPPGGPPSGGPPMSDPTVRPANLLMSSDEQTVHGEVGSGGYVTVENQVIGQYDEETGLFTPIDGEATPGLVVREKVIDEDGNFLEMRAVTCGSKEGVIFGYQSQVTGKFFDSMQFSEVDLGGCPTRPAYRMTGDDGGRIVDGFFYAPMGTLGANPLGEVVYFADENGGSCVVMAIGWDEGMEEMDEDERYEQQVELWLPAEGNESAALGTQDMDYYGMQHIENGEAAAPNHCVANRVISAP